MIDATKQHFNNEIILYQTPDFAIDLQVRIENETVWLTQKQMSELFQTSRRNITFHTSNIFKEGELDEFSVGKDYFLTASDGKSYNTRFYNLDVIISVGYRVKSIRGTQFRIWANKVLKDYLLKGYAISHRFENLERKVYEHDKQLEILIQQALPPKEGIFFDGQIFDAYELVVKLVKSAKKSIILIDNYIDETTLRLLSKREENVKCTIYTLKNSPLLKLDIEKYNAQFDKISIINFTKSHDRFLIIDKRDLYHIGASLKDVGKKWFAFSKLHLDIKQLLENIEKIMDTNSEN